MGQLLVDCGIAVCTSTPKASHPQQTD